jgi:hypothetical protein
MKFHTKRYDIRKVGGDDWNRDINYEISLNDDYVFSDGSGLDYAENLEELRNLISDIEKRHKKEGER